MSFGAGVMTQRSIDPTQSSANIDTEENQRLSELVISLQSQLEAARAATGSNVDQSLLRYDPLSYTATDLTGGLYRNVFTNLLTVPGTVARPGVDVDVITTTELYDSTDTNDLPWRRVRSANNTQVGVVQMPSSVGLLFRVSGVGLQGGQPGCEVFLDMYEQTEAKDLLDLLREQIVLHGSCYVKPPTQDILKNWFRFVLPNRWYSIGTNRYQAPRDHATLDVLRRDALRIRVARSGGQRSWKMFSTGSYRNRTDYYANDDWSLTEQWSETDHAANVMYFTLGWENSRAVTIRGAHIAHLGGLMTGDVEKDKRVWSSTFANFA
jgi:hypothetical protein